MDKKLERLETHLRVLNKSYDNIISVMEEDVEKKKDKDTEKETIALKDDKIKTYAEGIKKSAETLDFLFKEITLKEKELEEEKALISQQPDSKKEEQTTQKKTLQKHLQ